MCFYATCKQVLQARGGVGVNSGVSTSVGAANLLGLLLEQQHLPAEPCLQSLVCSWLAVDNKLA